MSTIQIINEENLNTDLTNVANVIKNKSNTFNSSLAFPEHFINGINSLYIATDWFDLTKPVGDIYYSGGFFDNMINGRTKVTKIFGTTATGISASCITGCTSLKYIICPKCYVVYTSGCSNNTNLITVDLGGTPSSSYGFIRQSGFSGCTKLTTLILRGNAVWALSNINNFTNTCFASGKTGGTLYVPRALIDSYKAATNWSTILGYTKTDGETLQNKILPIEDSIYQAQYGDGTPLPGASVSSTGKAYMPIMRLDANGASIANALSPYGNMPDLQELTLIGDALTHSGSGMFLYSSSILFPITKYPSLKKLYIQPSSVKKTANSELLTSFSVGHYCFSQTNLTELVLGQIGGPYFSGGGYFRNDMPRPPGTSTTQVGSLDGLTITVYVDSTNQYLSTAGFQNGTVAPNTTIICKDYITGDIITPS